MILFASEDCIDSEEKGRSEHCSKVLRIGNLIAVKRYSFGQLFIDGPVFEGNGGAFQDDILMWLMINKPRHLFLRCKDNGHLSFFGDLHDFHRSAGEFYPI